MSVDPCPPARAGLLRSSVNARPALNAWCSLGAFVWLYTPGKPGRRWKVTDTTVNWETELRPRDQSGSDEDKSFPPWSVFLFVKQNWLFVAPSPWG